MKDKIIGWIVILFVIGAIMKMCGGEDSPKQTQSPADNQLHYKTFYRFEYNDSEVELASAVADFTAREAEDGDVTINKESNGKIYSVTVKYYKKR